MATALRRRAVAMAAEAAIPASSPAIGSFRNIAALAIPRLAASATKPATTLRLSSATATVRNGISAPLRLSSAIATIRNGISAPLRRCHTAAVPEAFEVRIQRLEVDIDKKIIALRVELQKGSEEACSKIENIVVESCHRLERAHLEACRSYLQGQSKQDERMNSICELLMAQGRRNVTRAANSSAEQAQAIIQVGKVSWRLVVTVAGAVASTAFATAQILTTGTTTHQTEIADDRARIRTAEITDSFNQNLEHSVGKAVELALAKEARRRAVADEESLHAFTAQMDEVINGLDRRIERAVEVAQAKQALEKKNAVGGDTPAGGGGPNSI